MLRSAAPRLGRALSCEAAGCSETLTPGVSRLKVSVNDYEVSFSVSE